MHCGSDLNSWTGLFAKVAKWIKRWKYVVQVAGQTGFVTTSSSWKSRSRRSKEMEVSSWMSRSWISRSLRSRSPRSRIWRSKSWRCWNWRSKKYSSRRRRLGSWCLRSYRSWSWRVAEEASVTLPSLMMPSLEDLVQLTPEWLVAEV